ncbi:MAG TPA: uracil-DNA glycosylase [Phycisphaerae bacterium]|nr:uracil-DNA glycosylase [Phycisphaerae bacterium]
MTDEEKRRRLAELSEQAAEELGKHLNDVATKVVFGEGDPAAKLMFIGEGPGAQEDQLGRPFVGRAGQLLDKMILAMGLQRQQVYIANVVKLRAAEPDPQTGRLKDRPPTTEEAALGLPWLVKQIEIIRPHVIVTLGASAARHLLGETSNMTSLRGNWRTFRGIQVMPTYHPSFLLRAYTPENRGRVWSDLKAVMNRLGLKVKSSSGPA